MFKNIGFQNPRPTSRSPIKRQNIVSHLSQAPKTQAGSVSPMKITRKPDMAKVPLPFRPNRSIFSKPNQPPLINPKIDQKLPNNQRPEQTKLFQKLLKSKRAESIPFNPSQIKYISNPSQVLPSTPKLLLSKEKVIKQAYAIIPNKQLKENLNEHNHDKVMMSIADHDCVNLSDYEDSQSRQKEYKLTMDPSF